jgi:hypothetical protein
MKIFALTLALSALAGTCWAAALGTSTRSCIPGDVQQIISVDYRALRNNSTAQALKNQVLPENLKAFETSLRGVGINPEKELEQLTFVSFRTPKQGLKVVGFAQGQFTEQLVLRKLRLRKIKPLTYSSAAIYPMGDGMQMSFLDNSTLLFGDSSAIRGAVDARDGTIANLDGNSEVADMLGSVESEPVWSVLDAVGTQNMMRSALGEAAQLADYNQVKKRLVGSHYIMNFNSGVDFDLDVLTSDSMMAATLSSLVKAGMLYRKMTASPVEKVALDSLTVSSDSSALKLHFRTDDNRFQSLLHSDLFAAVSH